MPINDISRVKVADVRNFWNKNPLAASSVPFPLGSAEYFKYYDRLREESESVEFSYRLHEYGAFKGRKVLDIGCGNGYILARYAREGAQVFGVDITDTAIDLCRKRFDINGLKGNFCVASAEELPFEDQTFDCVCSMGVLHHTPDTQRAIFQAQRVLKKNGIIILMFYHRDSILNRIIVPINKIFNIKNWKKPTQVLINDLDGCGNPKSAVYSRNEMRLALKSGIRDLKIFTGLAKAEMVGLFSYLTRLGPLLPVVSRFGWFLYVKGKK